MVLNLGCTLESLMELLKISAKQPSRNLNSNNIWKVKHMCQYLFPGESIVEPILSTLSSSCQLLILFHISTSVALEKFSLTFQMRFGLLKDVFTAPEFFYSTLHTCKLLERRYGVNFVHKCVSSS